MANEAREIKHENTDTLIVRIADICDDQAPFSQKAFPKYTLHRSPKFSKFEFNFYPITRTGEIANCKLHIYDITAFPDLASNPYYSGYTVEPVSIDLALVPAGGYSTTWTMWGNIIAMIFTWPNQAAAINCKYMLNFLWS